MRILITGGTGFQGSHLTEHFLREGHEVTVLNTFSQRSKNNVASIQNRQNLNVVWGSITDKEIVDKTIKDQDVVFHLAARINVDESIEEPSSYLDVNVYGTYNILEAVRKYGNRLIYASTCEVYGAPAQKQLINEETELRPYSPYAASKAAADRLCFAYYKTFDINVTIVRPFNIYGPRQKDEKGGAVIAIFANKASKGEILKVFGSGEQTRDYLYIDDLVKAYDLVFKNNKLKGEVINFGTGQEIKIKEIAEYIAKKLNTKVEYAASRKGEVERFAADITKAKKLGFSPTVKIWDGIDKYLLWKSQQK